MVTRRKNISQKAPIVGSQFYVYDLNRLICGSIHFKSIMINFCQPKISSSHMCAVRFLDGVELMACSMAALSLTLYCKQTNQKLSPPSQLLLILYKCVATVTV